MSSSLIKVHTELCKQREEMKEKIFEEPPFAFEDFKTRLGRYMQLKADIELVEQTMKGNENDDI